MDVYERLGELNVELPEPPQRGGIYKPVMQCGNMIYVSGQGPIEKGVPTVTGKLGAERSIEEGQRAARICALNALSLLHQYLGDLNKIRHVVKLLAFVESAPGFNKQPEVVNGGSQLLVDIFGEERGMGARSAIGANELPNDISVEIEFVFEVEV